MTSLIALVCNGLALPLDAIALALSIRRSGSPYLWLVLAVANGFSLVASVLLPVWPLVPVNGACCLFAAWMWWRNRRGRGRLRAVLGGKYAHVRDAMARTLRERGQRRVLRPVPGLGR